MPFKPFAHLARVSFAKGLTHSYAPSVVAAPQTLGQFQHQPIAKFSKATHLQNAFTTTSSGSGAGAKAGSTTQSSGGDGGLGQYYAAWQHAQQTGDDTDWRQHQFARRIGWKHLDKNTQAKQPQRLESARGLESLRSSSKVLPRRAYSDDALYDTKRADASLAEAEALARVDQAIAQEIEDIKISSVAASTIALNDDVGSPLLSTRAATPSIQQDSSQFSESVSSSQLHSTSTDATSPALDSSISLSDKIVRLGQQNRYTEIPAIFQTLVKEGLIPTVDAYNYILLSAINLSNGYQPWPRALEVYGDMTKRGVELNDATYGILLQFLTTRSQEVHKVQKQLDQRALRYGSLAHPFIFNSTAHQQQLYADDISLPFATKLYNIARATLNEFSLSSAVYNGMVSACAQFGMLEQMNILLSDMKANAVQLEPALYTAIIDAHASVGDISAAQSLYEAYRDLAISRASNDVLDMHVYAALIKAYHTCGLADTGLHFYKKIVQSFNGAAHQTLLTQQLNTAFVQHGLVQYYIDERAFSTATACVSEYALEPVARDQAFSKISVTAADANSASDAQVAYGSIIAPDAKADAALAITAMHLRAKNVVAAKSAWEKAKPLPLNLSSDFATMYALALVRDGLAEEAILEARSMFHRIRAAAPSETVRDRIMAEIDESIVLFGEALVQRQTVVSAQTSVGLLRAMIENGGLVSPVAEHAIASLGPECIHQLSSQDIALALHVQAQMLPLEPAVDTDIASTARFSHLLETVITRGILMDPSTVHVISEAMPKIGTGRPDLLPRWQEYLNPTPKSLVSAQPLTPTTPQSTFADTAPVADNFDPYAHTTDFRASKIISELLESNTGRIENHLSDALSRFRNVRRAGRHLHYSAYAKLITAAGKAKRPSLIQEILGMAQADVPFSLDIPAVKNGWVTVFDSIIAACLTVGDRKLAGKYHQQLLDMGSAPSANTFGIYITTLEGTFDEATEAVKIFQRALAEGVAPSVFLYNAVIGKLGKARRIDDCLRYFGDMQNQGIRPSSVTYGTLVNALCRTSEESFAVEMFDEMEAAPNYRPRPAPYNSIIQYFLNTKRDRSKVLQYYERMKTKNIRPTSHTYKLLIEAYASLEPVNLEAAEAMLQEMKAAGVQPESVHYGSLIHAKGCVMHDMPGARAVFDSVVSDGVVRPTDNLYQNLLEAMVANHEVSKTQEVLDDMKRRGVLMTPYIANTLIHGWAGEGEITKAKAIYNQLGTEKREPSTYEAMTRAFLSAEDHGSANLVVQEMLRKGYPAAVSDKVLALVGGAGA